MLKMQQESSGPETRSRRKHDTLYRLENTDFSNNFENVIDEQLLRENSQDFDNFSASSSTRSATEVGETDSFISNEIIMEKDSTEILQDIDLIETEIILENDPPETEIIQENDSPETEIIHENDSLETEIIQKVDATTPSPDELCGTPFKRGRGRPKKSVTPIDSTKPSNRGRQKKSVTSKDSIKPSNRGRPKKKDKDSTETEFIQDKDSTETEFIQDKDSIDREIIQEKDSKGIKLILRKNLTTDNTWAVQLDHIYAYLPNASNIEIEKTKNSDEREENYIWELNDELLQLDTGNSSNSPAVFSESFQEKKLRQTISQDDEDFSNNEDIKKSEIEMALKNLPDTVCEEEINLAGTLIAENVMPALKETPIKKTKQCRLIPTTTKRKIISVQNEGHKFIKCNYCQKEFNLRADLLCHNIVAHKEMLNTYKRKREKDEKVVMNTVKKPPIPVAFKCFKCGKKYEFEESQVKQNSRDIVKIQKPDFGVI
uniref:C2H2-type domain-containing protein n=1 Tax=Strigamia maritima TaxID=126957 RepID=T1JH55_STRMM